MLKSYANLGEFDGIVCIAGIVHIKEGDLDKVFGNMYEVLKENGILLLVFKNGVGEKLTSTFNNKIYTRNFVYHTKEEIAKYIYKYFSEVKDLTPLNDETEWKYIIYKKK